MPTLGLIATADAAVAAAKQKQADATPGEEEATPKKDSQSAPALKARALDDAATLWSKKGDQTYDFVAAVCNCLNLGLSQTEITQHVREKAYAEPIAANDKLYPIIYVWVQYASHAVWKKEELGKTSQAVDVAPGKPHNKIPLIVHIPHQPKLDNANESDEPTPKIKNHATPDEVDKTLTCNLNKLNLKTEASVDNKIAESRMDEEVEELTRVAATGAEARERSDLSLERKVLDMKRWILDTSNNPEMRLLEINRMIDHFSGPGDH